ncbi:signal recognition particle 9 kDa protein-like protein [Tanacetum coccineum]
MRRLWAIQNGSHPGISRLAMSKTECLKFKTDQAQDAKKMEKLNNIFFTLMARGPETDITEVTGKEQAVQPAKKGRARKQ